MAFHFDAGAGYDISYQTRVAAWHRFAIWVQ
jgi:hypothetical protein